MGVLEKEVEKHLRLEIKKLGGKAYKFVSPGNSGVPDRLVVLPGGRTFFVELKSATGRLTPLQNKQIDYLRKLGQDVLVVRSTEDVARLISVVREWTE